MKQESILIIEVPHAMDILLETFDLESFKKFTFWSEHLALYTRNTLTLLLNYCGFIEEKVLGKQRYPLSNHLKWLKDNKPGGHNEFVDFNDTNLNLAYEKLLNDIDRTDTIIGYFKVNPK